MLKTERPGRMDIIKGTTWGDGRVEPGVSSG
jgi:hypothetical protein